jgi:tRNA-dihydrouridine synthase
MYTGQADWSIIRQVKEAVSIPVIGNGDVTCPQDAVRLMDETGCDGVMIGRAALGYPWIFREVAHFLATGETLAPPDASQRIDVAIEHLHLLVEEKGVDTGVKEMRKHAGWYIKGLPKAAQLRDVINAQTSVDGMEAVLRSIVE